MPVLDSWGQTPLNFPKQNLKLEFMGSDPIDDRESELFVKSLKCCTQCFTIVKFREKQMFSAYTIYGREASGMKPAPRDSCVGGIGSAAGIIRRTPGSLNVDQVQQGWRCRHQCLSKEPGSGTGLAMSPPAPVRKNRLRYSTDWGSYTAFRRLSFTSTGGIYGRYQDALEIHPRV